MVGLREKRLMILRDKIEVLGVSCRYGHTGGHRFVAVVDKMASDVWIEVCRLR